MKACFLFILSLLSAAIAAPVFAPDFTVTEEQSAVMYQGPYITTKTSLCCPLGSNCKVELQFLGYKKSFDYTHQRVRFDGDSTEVDDFTLQKEMAITGSPGNWSCVEYCPMYGDKLQPYGIGNATDMGSTTYREKKVEWYQEKVVILYVVVMEIDNTYIELSSPYAIPVGAHNLLTPFGVEMGYVDAEYRDFVEGTPDPALFDIKGVDKCPEAPNCEEESRQVKRLIRRNYLTYQHHVQAKTESRLLGH